MRHRPLAWLVVFALAHPYVLADEPAAQLEPEADQFVVPDDATPDELKAIITRLSKGPRARFSNQQQAIEYFRSASKSVIAAAEKLLAATDDQELLDLAVEAKAASLFVLGQTGDAEAERTAEEFLEQMAQHENAALASAAKRISIEQSLRNARRMGAEQRDKLYRDLYSLLQSTGYSLDAVRLAANVANVMSDSPNETDRAMSIELIKTLLPKMLASEDEKIVAMAPKLEGVMRRTQLPGNFMDVEGTLLSGDVIDWESYRGKVVLVDYWATWCGPCIAELPNVKQNYENYHEKGFDVIGISLDESPEKVADFLEARDIPWSTLFSADPKATLWNHPMAVKYGVRGIPRAILVDKDGKVVHMNARGKALSEQLQGLLGDPIVKNEDKTMVDERVKTVSNP